MNLIIELILKIFQAIFEGGQPTAIDSSQKGTSRQGNAGAAPHPSTIIQDLFREMQGLNGPPPLPKAQRLPKRQPVQPPVETLLEHIQKQEAHQADLDMQGGPAPIVSAEPMRAHLSHLPGRNPLEQMIYAGVILGPCKARQQGKRLL